jgi:hypothetical protein
MIIGNFTYDKARDTYTGELATLSVATRRVVFQPNEAKGDKAPSYRVIGPSKTGDVEFSAAWEKRQRGRPRLPLGQARRSGAPAAGQLRWWSPAIARVSSSYRRRTAARRRPNKPGRGRSARAAPSGA